MTCGTYTTWNSLPCVLQVWVSEIMLQQTQVATVIPYYNKWMERSVHLLPADKLAMLTVPYRFPTIRDLVCSTVARKISTSFIFYTCRHLPT